MQKRKNVEFAMHARKMAAAQLRPLPPRRRVWLGVYQNIFWGTIPDAIQKTRYLESAPPSPPSAAKPEPIYFDFGSLPLNGGNPIDFAPMPYAPSTVGGRRYGQSYLQAAYLEQIRTTRSLGDLLELARFVSQGSGLNNREHYTRDVIGSIGVYPPTVEVHKGFNGGAMPSSYWPGDPRG